MRLINAKMSVESWNSKHLVATHLYKIKQWIGKSPQTMTSLIANKKKIFLQLKNLINSVS